MSNITKSKEPNYFYFYRLISDFNFKTEYKNNANAVFKENGIRLGIWGINNKNNKEGINDNGKWCWRNTINTHSYSFYELYHFLDDEQKKLLDFENPSSYRSSIKLFWKLINENFDLYFTKNITNEYYNKLYFRTSQSWSKGVITNIFFIMSLDEIYGDKLIKKEYSFERGDDTDFRGIDFVIELKDNIKHTIQLKSGKHVFDGDDYILDSAVNDLKSPANYYCFFDISNFNGASNVLMFENKKELIRKVNGFTHFPKELLYKKFVNTMETPQALKNILWYCGPRQINFELNLEAETNDVTIISENEKRIIININNIYDDYLADLLNDKLAELRDIFK